MTLVPICDNPAASCGGVVVLSQGFLFDFSVFSGINSGSGGDFFNLHQGVGGAGDFVWVDGHQAASQCLDGGGGLIGGVVSGVSTFVIGFIFSIYILLQKEKLGRQAKQVLYALLPLFDRLIGVFA